MSKIRRWTTTALLALSLSLGTSLVSVAPAQAATGWVYISFPKWLGNCPAGGSVFAILGSVGGTWTTGPKYDWGDDLVYAKVNLGANQQVSAQVWCARSPGNSRPSAATVTHSVMRTIKPTRNNQTVWVGLNGVSY